MTDWQREQLDYLTENAGVLSPAEIAQHTGHTVKAVYEKAHVLGVTLRREGVVMKQCRRGHYKGPGTCKICRRLWLLRKKKAP